MRYSEIKRNLMYCKSDGIGAMYLMSKIDEFKGIGYDLDIRDDLIRVIDKMLNIKVIYKSNVDFINGRYILTSNHISNFDVINLGMLPFRNGNINKNAVIAKDDWTKTPLVSILCNHFDFISVNRSNKRDAVLVFNKVRDLFSESSYRNLVIFPQGTISNIKMNSIERIQMGVFRIAAENNVPILPVALEAPSEVDETNIVVGKPYFIDSDILTFKGKDKKEVFKSLKEDWIEKIIELYDSIDNFREPILVRKYRYNNNPKERYF